MNSIIIISYTFFTLAKTPRLGPNIKVFALLLVIVPLLVWPFFMRKKLYLHKKYLIYPHQNRREEEARRIKQHKKREQNRKRNGEAKACHSIEVIFLVTVALFGGFFYSLFAPVALVFDSNDTPISKTNYPKK